MFSLAKLLALAGLAALVAASPKAGFVKHPRRQYGSDPALAPSSPAANSLTSSPSLALEASSSLPATTSAPTDTTSFALAASSTGVATAEAIATASASLATDDSTASLAYAPTVAAPADAGNSTAPAGNATGVEVSIDVTVLQLAFVLENLEAKFYQQALDKFSLEVMVEAGLSHFQAAIVIEQVTAIQIDEATHVTVLADTLVALGAEPFTGCGFNFDAALTDPMTFLSTARVLEAAGVSAYLGAAHLLTDPSLLLAASSIVTLEARHQSLLNVLNGGSYNPQAFDLPLMPQGVLALAGGFLDGCDAGELGLIANEALTIVDEATQAGRFVPGSKLSFSTIVDIDISVLTCQILIGGQPIALTFPAAKCAIPAGVDGPVAVYLTNSSTPLATNVVIQAQASIVAGPGLIFVDAQVSVLAAVLSPLAGGREGDKHQRGGKAHKQDEPALGSADDSATTSDTASVSETATSTNAAGEALSTTSTSSSMTTSSSSSSSAAVSSAIAGRFARRAAQDRRALPTIQEALGKRRLSASS
ncbi:hypothetical protein JCM10449v2_005880 [Rhodotorula kratochvilovae]